MRSFVGQSVALATVVTVVAGCGALAIPGLRGDAGGPQAASALKPRYVDPPQWAKDAVFYQIFPERFANGDKRNDPPGSEPWGSKPTYDNFMGGDLKGIRQNLDYLQSLGVTALYLNPIFAANSNHKYDTRDYMQIDPGFGTMQDFRDLVADLKKRKMRLLLDGVFNHTGDAHHWFQDASASGKVSPYWHHYNIYGYPVVYKPKPNYDSWWGFGSLPKLNFNNPAVPNYVLDKVVDFWGRQGIDGWRLDVPNEVNLPGFWERFRARVRAINPEAYIVGEIWDDPSPWIQGDKFDATMNYPFRKDILTYVGERRISVDQLDTYLAGQRGNQGTATNGMFNILGSHDVERLRTLVGSGANQRVAALIQMTYPGAPVVYYGDEVGMEGGKDPDDRRCFDWSGSSWDRPMLAWYQKLINIRKAHPALRDGWFHTVMRHNDKRLWAYYRERDGGDRVLVVMNAGSGAQDVAVPLKETKFADGTRLVDLLSGKTYQASGGQVVLGGVAPGGAILVADPAKGGRR
ncbi:MAG: glycoside hydrolase family 13 protein [Candidatus Sericytochromatia bacterium]|nr:glycoside hydrolase family 13 protein [Candidatus Tanganyikabacteria bacterium]